MHLFAATRLDKLYPGPFTGLITATGNNVIALTNARTSLAEDSNTISVTWKMGDIVITDDALGTNAASLSGADAASFEVVANNLMFDLGVALNYETQSRYAVTLTTGSVSIDHTLTITDVDEAPMMLGEQAIF